MIKINLNKKPKKIKIRIETGGLIAYFIVPVVFAAIAIFLLQSSIDKKINDLNKNIKSYNNETALLLPKVIKVNAIKKKEAETLQKINIIKTLKKAQMGPVGYIYYITAAIPRFSWINSLKSNKGSIALTGIALDGQVVSIFMNNLSKTGFFDGVSLVQTSEIKKQGLKLQNFSLTMNVKGTFLRTGVSRANVPLKTSPAKR
ncbi:MAG: PilN domain-containing protein [bacterium]